MGHCVCMEGRSERIVRIEKGFLEIMGRKKWILMMYVCMYYVIVALGECLVESVCILGGIGMREMCGKMLKTWWH